MSDNSSYDNGKKRSIVVGCIYRHPNNNLTNFIDQLNNIIKSINPNKYDLFLLGDINIDFMKANSHPETDEYLNMLFSHGLLPIVTKPTRITCHSATLIDHIYTNYSTHLSFFFPIYKTMFSLFSPFYFYFSCS